MFLWKWNLFFTPISLTMRMLSSPWRTEQNNQIRSNLFRLHFCFSLLPRNEALKFLAHHSRIILMSQRESGYNLGECERIKAPSQSTRDKTFLQRCLGKVSPETSWNLMVSVWSCNLFLKYSKIRIAKVFLMLVALKQNAKFRMFVFHYIKEQPETLLNFDISFEFTRKNEQK